MKRPSSRRSVGWDGASAINQSPQQCSFEQAVLACREEYQVELSLGRLKGEPLSLTPMYLHHDESASRLIQMLSLGARPDLAGRRRPKKTGPQRRNTKGLSAGKPTCARLDRRPNSCGLPSNNMVVAGTMEPQTQVHLSSLSDHQQTILHLLELPLATDSGLGVRFFKPSRKSMNRQ